MTSKAWSIALYTEIPDGDAIPIGSRVFSANIVNSEGFKALSEITNDLVGKNIPSSYIEELAHRRESLIGLVFLYLDNGTFDVFWRESEEAKKFFGRPKVMGRNGRTILASPAWLVLKEILWAGEE